MSVLVSVLVSVLSKVPTLGLGMVLISLSSFLRLDHLILKRSFEPTLTLLGAISSGRCEKRGKRP